MSTIYDRTDNYGLNLYGDNDPADLRDGYNGSMRTIDTTLETHLNRIEGMESRETHDEEVVKALIGDNTADNATAAKTKWDKAGTDAIAAKDVADSNTAILAALGVQTTQQARHLNDVTKINDYLITPQMFGAKGDGVTDDSQAFNDAIDAIVHTYNVDGLYYTLFVPAGEYLIEHTITLHSFICLKSLGEVTFLVNTQIGFLVKHVNVHLDGKTTGQLFDGSNGIITIRPKDNTQIYNGTAISINDPASPNFMRGKTFNYLKINNFNYAYDIVGNDIYLTNFFNIEIEFCNYGIHFRHNDKNAGEMLRIQNSTMSCKKECITIANGYELYVSDSSFDYTSTALHITEPSNRVVFDNCHFEGILDGPAIVSTVEQEQDFSKRGRVIMQNCSIINSRVPFATAVRPNTLTLSYSNTYEKYLSPESLTNRDICNDNVLLTDFTPSYYPYNPETGGKTKNILDDEFKKLKIQTKTNERTLEYENSETGWTVVGNATLEVKSDETYGKIIEVSNITTNSVALISPPITLANATRFISGFDAKTATPSMHGAVVLFDDDDRHYNMGAVFTGNMNKAKEVGDVWHTVGMYYNETSCNYSSIRVKISIYHSSENTSERYQIAKPRLFAY